MRFGAGSEVLRDVTFLLEAGSFTFLTGASGAAVHVGSAYGERYEAS